jgi:hypothetical protein
MRKRASADHRDRKAAHLSLVRSAPPRVKRQVPAEPGVSAHIGNLLRAMYDSALNEPVPQRFLDLLREMDAKTEPAAEVSLPGPGPAETT